MGDKKTSHTPRALTVTNKQQTNSTLFRSLVHTYFKSLGYKIKVHRQLEMLFIHHHTSSRNLIKLTSANVEKSTILD